MTQGWVTTLGQSRNKAYNLNFCNFLNPHTIPCLRREESLLYLKHILLEGIQEPASPNDLRSNRASRETGLYTPTHAGTLTTQTQHNIKKIKFELKHVVVLTKTYLLTRFTSHEISFTIGQYAIFPCPINIPSLHLVFLSVKIKCLTHIHTYIHHRRTGHLSTQSKCVERT